jgi:NAD(P)H-dependent FMN reductase
MFDLSKEQLPFYVPGVTSGVHASVSRLISLVLSADALIISSPVYQACLSGAVKNALDHLHDMHAVPQPLTGYRVGLIAVTAKTGAATCLSALRTACIAMGAEVSSVQASISSTVLDANGVLYDPVPDERLESMVQDLLNGPASRRQTRSDDSRSEGVGSDD